MIFVIPLRSQFSLSLARQVKYLIFYLLSLARFTLSVQIRFSFFFCISDQNLIWLTVHIMYCKWSDLVCVSRWQFSVLSTSIAIVLTLHPEVMFKQTKMEGNEISLLICHVAMCSCGTGFITVRVRALEVEEVCLHYSSTGPSATKLACFLYAWWIHELYFRQRRKKKYLESWVVRPKCICEYECGLKWYLCDFWLFRLATYDQIPIGYAHESDFAWQFEHDPWIWDQFLPF